MSDSRDTMRWLWRAGALAVLAIGWLFVLWQNNFHLSAPVVFVCLGYLAVVATVYNLWQTGAAAVAGTDDEADSTWAKPVGAIGELEREKRTLLKAIKEAEFDHQMGKLSKHDVDEMVKGYRARAIEVIKEIDRLGAGTAGTTRDQILREVRARIEIESRPSKKAKQAKPDVKAEVNAGAKPEVNADASAAAHAQPTADAVSAASEAETEAPSEAAVGDAASAKPAPAPSGTSAGKAGSKSKKQRGKRASAVVATASPAVTPAPVATAAAEQADDAAQDDAESDALHDEAMNADSTTTVEPRRSDSAKEAMR